MSVEESVYTRQPAMSASQLRDLAKRQGLELRFLDLDGKPLDPTARLDEPMYRQGYVLIGWPAPDAQTTESVERALLERDKPELDRLGLAGKFGWCSIGCAEFDFAEFEALLTRDLEDEDDDEDQEPLPDEVLERLRQARTKYSFRCATRPRQCGELLGKVAELIREATDGFGDE
jgi:hypothetical protein